jgi:hypothetical protein
MKTIEELKEIIRNEYTDPDGLVCQDRFPGKWASGNGLMQTGYYICLLYALNALDKSDIDRFKNTVIGCQDEPGLYDRNPGRPDLNAHDDYIGIAGGSVVSGLNFHKEIFNYGRKHFWFFDNTQSNSISDRIKSFRARNIPFFTYIHLVNNKMKFLKCIVKNYINNSESYHIILGFIMLISLASIYDDIEEYAINIIDDYKIKLIGETKRYFGETHPLVELVKFL